eukprot:2081322-Prymnesium_polylepis.1
MQCLNCCGTGEVAGVSDARSEAPTEATQLKLSKQQQLPRYRSDSVMTEEEEEKRRRPWYDRSTTYVTIAYICTFSSVMNFAMLSPFFPGVAEDIGVSSGEISLIFALVPVGNFIFSLIAPPLIKRLSNMIVLRYALFSLALFTGFFGTIIQLPSASAFTLWACVIRFAQGAASGLAEVAAVSLLWRAVKAEAVPAAVGGLSAFRALGVLVGP